MFATLARLAPGGLESHPGSLARTVGSARPAEGVVENLNASAYRSNGCSVGICNSRVANVPNWLADASCNGASNSPQPGGDADGAGN